MTLCRSLGVWVAWWLRKSKDLTTGIWFIASIFFGYDEFLNWTRVCIEKNIYQWDSTWGTWELSFIKQVTWDPRGMAQLHLLELCLLSSKSFWVWRRNCRSDVVMNPFIFLLTCHKPKHSFISIWKVITLINHFWKRSLIVEGDSVQWTAS